MPRRQRLSRRGKNWKRKRTEEIRSSLECNVSIPLSPLNLLKDQILSHGNLPHGWIVISCCTEYLQLCQIHKDTPDVVHFSLKIKSDFRWLLYLHGVKVVAKVLAEFPDTIRSIESLNSFIMKLESHTICIGNPDMKFKPLEQARHGVFKNARGTEVVAEVECAIVGKRTIRHTGCEMLLCSGQTGLRCSKCKGHRNSLHVMLERLKASRSSDSTSSHANYRYLTPAICKSRMHNLHKKCALSKRRIVRMKKKVKLLLERKGIAVDKRTNSDLRAILKESYSQISEKYAAGTFQRVFWKQHSAATACKNAKGNRWHPAMIRWCLYLRHLSGKAYEMLRSSGVLLLPSQRTLRDYTHYVPATTGFSSEVDEMLMKTLKVKSCSPLKLWCVLLMDEMHIKEGLVFDKHSGELIGFTNLGEMNNYVANLEKATDNSKQRMEPLAKSMLVLMVRGLLSGFEFPYVQFPCSSLTGDQLYNVFWEAVDRLERMDIKVLGVTCDGYSVNRRFLKIHAKDKEAGINHKMSNPFAQEERDIFFFSDPPHLVKTVRNSWASKKRNLWCNGKDITWQHLIQLYKRGTGADREAPGLSLVMKLRYEHIYLTSYSKMRVDLAAQVLSESVSNALTFSGRDDVSETAKFARYFDKFFDALNVKSLTEGKHKRKDFRLPYTSGSDSRLTWLEKDFLSYLDSWKASVDARKDFSPSQKLKMQITQETLLGIRITTLSFIGLVKFIFTIPEVKFFLSEKISQDPIEKFFGCQRQRGSTNENPTVQQACKNTQALRVINTSCRHVSRGNTRGNKAPAGDQNLDEPLMKRRRRSTKK